MRNEAASSGLRRGQSYLSDLFPRGIIPPRNKVREKLSAVISAARVDGDADHYADAHQDGSLPSFGDEVVDIDTRNFVDRRITSKDDKTLVSRDTRLLRFFFCFFFTTCVDRLSRKIEYLLLVDASVTAFG